jgi:hypothetical protein
MRVALIVLGILLAIGLIVAVIGYRLPAAHHASRQATFAVSPESVYAAITTVTDFPKWRPKVKSVDVLSPTSFREKRGDGDVLFALEEVQAPSRVVTRIADDKLPFGGKWTYEIARSAAGTTLRITEDGEVYNPIFRFVSKFVFGHQASIDEYLRDLGKKFGSTPSIID